MIKILLKWKTLKKIKNLKNLKKLEKKYKNLCKRTLFQSLIKILAKIIELYYIIILKMIKI